MTADESAVDVPARAAVGESTALTAARLLDFERSCREQRLPLGARIERIRAELGTSEAHYVMLLNRVIDTTPALEHDPILTHQLIDERRRRNAQARGRRPRMLLVDEPPC
ncbi:DUF3263 domain-containing protein [Microbacterium karelineae]|uniref:DUF3263 domain-containing protein n=1 Tax=Microbacterium karelineae TaxID=2654283 RepID=UPI0012E9F7A1|nr:DUF3263 domain-containing protein [Microbacterium karelineae]